MAKALMSGPRLTNTLLIGLVLVCSPALPSFATATLQEVFQPVLTGFRCEGSNEVTSDGVVIIEADSPVKITLFGEYFTTETIVGFTTEFVPHADVVDQMISRNDANLTAQHTTSSSNTSLRAARSPHFSARASAGPELVQTNLVSNNSGDSSNSNLKHFNLTRSEPSESGSNSSSASTPSSLSSTASARSAPPPHQFRVRTESELKQQRRRRRLLDRRSYDCTDYDRVISYRLREENIITPNVAVLTIRLPELGSGTGMYYYFCLKQPPIPHMLLALEEEAAAAADKISDADDDDGEHNTRAFSLASTSNVLTANGRAALSVNTTKQHVWVHQGDEWWLMIKVEPPILSIANDCVLIVLLLFLSAVTSGLNLGLMSLDMNELAVISSCGDPRERSYARTIAPLRKRGNYLLCSLLLGNVMVNSTLTVILEEMTSGVVAVIGSTLAIVVLGEIVPQAFCARQGLAIGAKTIYLTYAFMIITFPLSYPISCMLDCILGAEKGHVYDRERLMEFIRITGNHTQLEADEVAIISGALKLKKIKVDQIMTKLEDVFMLPIDCMLDRKTIKSIIEKGYSRIPVYEFGDRKQIVALILAKDLALLDPDDQMPLANMLMYCKHPLIFIEDTATLDVALNEFKTGKSHMAIVRQIYDDGEVDKYYEAIGVVTLEDVIEEVLQTEINDETDTLSDNRRKRRRTEAQVAHLVDELILENPAKLK
jgi:CBS domain containing-hemolysin-like protein